jgi:hypothetical protein
MSNNTKLADGKEFNLGDTIYFTTGGLSLNLYRAMMGQPLEGDFYKTIKTSPDTFVIETKGDDECLHNLRNDHYLSLKNCYSHPNNILTDFIKEIQPALQRAQAEVDKLKEQIQRLENHKT